MPTYSFRDARNVVVERVLALRKLETESVRLGEAAGRVSAQPVQADRDYPPVARSIRDGFAVRARDLPGTVDVIGEVRAGDRFDGVVGPGQCVEIMTGAPMPRGADAVVMVEHTRSEAGRMTTDRAPAAGEFINPAGAEARHGETILEAGTLLGFAQIGLLATVGKSMVEVYRQPQVAILATGDEVVPVDATPRDNQVRNCNAWTVAAQVARCGGIPVVLPVARDDVDETRSLIGKGLERDMLLLTGGVSAGKYDFVEPVLAEYGAEFYFDRVLIQPGQPLVFGRAAGQFFFGLPGNPASAMVTFEAFGRAAVELLSGRASSELRLPRLRLTSDFRHKTGLTRFLPARVNEEGTEVTPLRWQGSSDVPALARANAWLVVDADREQWQAGEQIGVLFQ
ncbi:MAG: gephyrin-like molybdotransferase Glp [Bryobacteraceae bacterium]